MNGALILEGSIHFARQGRGARKELLSGPAPAAPQPGRAPRVVRLMALAIRLDGLVRSGAVADYAELARLGHVTRARISQIMNLLLLAPDIQEALLFLPKIESGKAPILLFQLQPIAATADWKKQRKKWAELTR